MRNSTSRTLSWENYPEMWTKIHGHGCCHILITAAIKGNNLNIQPLGSDEIHWDAFIGRGTRKPLKIMCSGYWMEWGHGHHIFVRPLNTSKYVANTGKGVAIVKNIHSPPLPWLWLQLWGLFWPLGYKQVRCWGGLESTGGFGRLSWAFAIAWEQT